MKTRILNFFKEYKDSVNWTMTLGWYFVFIISSQLDGLNLRGFLLTTLFFVVVTFTAWFQHKYIYNKKTDK